MGNFVTCSNYNRIKECSNIDDLISTWNQFENELCLKACNCGNKILKHDLAVLHANITDSLSNIQYIENVEEFENIKNILSDYVDFINQEEQMNILSSIKELEIVIQTKKVT